MRELFQGWTTPLMRQCFVRVMLNLVRVLLVRFVQVYRHPSCLIKHRWEHTPQWREASKFVLSKHQQVQLLEVGLSFFSSLLPVAVWWLLFLFLVPWLLRPVDGDAELDLTQAAAILSHLSPSSASLPEDRSLWPSFLSGGAVPPPASVSNGDVGPIPPPTTTTTTLTSPPASVLASPFNVPTSFPISSSVPASTVLDSYHAESTGPRLHDYTINRGGIGITQVRPGVLGVPTAMNGRSSPMAVAAATATTEDDALNLLALREADVTAGSWGSPTLASLSRPHSHSHSHSYTHASAHAHSHSLSYSHSQSLSLSHASKERERRRSYAYEYGFVSGSRSGFGPGTGFGFGYGYETPSSGRAYAPDSNGGWSLPRSSVRSKSGSSGSGSRSRSQSAASESRSDEEDEGIFGDGVAVRVDLEDEDEGGVDGARMSMRQRRLYGSHVRARKTEDGEGVLMDLSLREDEDEDAENDKGVGRGAEQMWDGMEMEMEMD